MKSIRPKDLLILLLLLGSSSLHQVAEGSNFTITAINSNSFLSRWNTALISPGSTSSQQIKLPLESSGSYNFTVDWGDGISDTITIWDQTEVTHTYATIGIYDLIIDGMLVGWRFNNVGDKLKIIEISQWGNIRLGNSNSYFYGCSNLQLTATDALNLTGTTTLNQAFKDCINLGNSGNMNNWDVSGIKSMRSMFQNFDETSSFDQPISNWDVSAVTDMESMFWGSSSFNQPIGDWNVSSVTIMGGMFLAASSFNQPIGDWDVSSVTSISMFNGASSFNQPIGDWDISSVTSLDFMFSASSFNQPIGNWDVSNVVSMDSMFSYASSFNQSIRNWDVSNVVSMDSMFISALSFNQPIGDWDVSSVTNMYSMFNGVTLSTANYDSLLAGWSALSLQSSITFHGGYSRYSDRNARQYIIDAFGWTIIDGGSTVFSSNDITSTDITSPIETVTATLEIHFAEETVTSIDRSSENFLDSNYFLILIFAIALLFGGYLIKSKSKKSSFRRDLSRPTHHFNAENVRISNLFCGACGTKLSLADVFCSECGTKT